MGYDAQVKDEGGEIAIVAADGLGELLGHIDDTGVVFDGGRGAIVGAGAEQLRRLLGQGYGRREFHMELRRLRLENCRIISPKMVFTYRWSRELEDEHTDEDVADTYPELIDGPDTYPDWSQP